ncbi:MAG: hypothetical protein R2761_11760 [Acidimicrobiales bacterium]
MDNKQAKAAAEAREILNRSAEVLEAEWQRLMRAFESSEVVPAPVKQQLTEAVNRLNAIVESNTPLSGRDVAREMVEAAGEVRSFVTGLAGAMMRTAAEAGFPVPGAAPAPDAGTATPPPPAPHEPAADEAPAPAEKVAEEQAAARKAVVKKRAAVKKAAPKASATAKPAAKKASSAKASGVKKASTTKKAGATKKAATKKAGAKKATTKKAPPARKRPAN